MTTRKTTSGRQPKEDPKHTLAKELEQYLEWLEYVIQTRMKAYFDGVDDDEDDEDGDLFRVMSRHLPRPIHGTPFEEVISELHLTGAEILTLLLAMAPQLRPQMLDIFFTKNTLFDRGFSEFGGVKGESHGGFIPTAETAIFLLSGKDLESRMRHRPLFLSDHRLYRLQLLQAQARAHKDVELSFPLLLSEEYKGYFFSGTVPRPEFGPHFPARLIETNLEWDDLVLDRQTAEDLQEIKSWLLHEQNLMEEWGLRRILKPGFRSLFYGSPGTGKSLAACLLGKLTGRDVYRIDLSMVVSKYIGETEKNLASVFDFAAEKKWILFFDEADALFGKRTNTSSSHDRYANQEVSYLLQRIEDFPGMVILATNFKNNIDSAFMRRFQSVVQFLKPDRNQRLRLWLKSFPEQIPISQAVDFGQLAGQYELTGGEIVNIVRHAALQAIGTPGRRVLLDHLLSGIRRELTKDGRMFEQYANE